MNNSKKGLVLILSLVMVFSATHLVLGWTGPTLTPPYGNLTAPLNLGATTQSKTGGLNIATQGGYLGVGTTNPGYLLDVNGTGSFTSVRNANFTSGTVLFTGTDGVISQDTSNLRWDNTNKRLGIGTVSPNATFHLKTASGNAELDIQSASSPYWGVYQDDATDDLRFWNTDNRVTFTDSGDVGIGTASPNGKLQVGANLTDANGSISGATTPVRLVVNGATSPALTLGYYSSGYGLDMWVGTTGLAPVYFDQRNKDAFIFRVFTGTTPTEVMRINGYNSTAGKVGIGTTAPGEKLHVVGNMKLDGSVGTYPVLTLTDSTAGGSGWAIISGFPNTGDLTFREAGVANHVVVKKTTGNFGIGTTAPVSKLEVVGTTTSSTGFKITTAGNGIQFADGSIQTTAPGANSLTLGNTFVGNASNVAVATTTLYINTASRVGIGTANPEAKLAIAGLPTSPGTIYKNHLQILDTTPQTTGVGGSISFLGNYSGTSMIDVGSGIGGYKTNSSGSVPAALDFGLNFWTRGAVSGVHSSMFITGEGGVGIGRMDVDPAYGITTNSLTGGIKSDTATTTPAGFYSNSIGPALVTNVGNVGIGTVTPATPLHIKGSGVPWRSMLNIEGGAADSSIGLTLYNGPTAQTNLMGKLDYDAGAAKTMTLANYNNGTGGNISINTFSATKNVLIPTGNVGIGTTNPTQTLQIQSGNADLVTGNLYFSTGAKGVLDRVNAQYGMYPRNTGDRLSLITAGAERLSILSDGNVGIGTTNPVFQTVIVGAGQATPSFADVGNKGAALLLSDSGYLAGSGGALLFGGTGGNGYFGTVKGLLTNGGTNSTGDIVISTRNAVADTSLTERFRVMGGGNVGIAEIAPGSKFSVYGGVAIGNDVAYSRIAVAPAGGMIVKGNVGIGTTAPGDKLHVAGGNLRVDTTNNGYGGFKIYDSSSGNYNTYLVQKRTYADSTIQLGFGNVNTQYTDWSMSVPVLVLRGDGAIGAGSSTIDNTYVLTTKQGMGGIKSVNNTTATPAGYFSNSTGPSLIADSGNVGIGTTNPLAKLDVVGDLRVFGGTYRTFLQQKVISSDARSGTDLLSDLSVNILVDQDANNGTAGSFRVLNGTTDSADNTKELFRVQGTGNVGIGTVAPSEKLEVNGYVKANDFNTRGLLIRGVVSNSPYTSSSWIMAPAGSGTFFVNSDVSRWAGLKSDGSFDVNGGQLAVLQTGNVGIGTASLSTINATAGLFSSVTPKTEILTGSGSGTYKEAVVIRHNAVDSTAVSRELGLLLKTSNEGTTDESNKTSGMMWWSNASYGNSGNFSLVHANNKVLTSDFSGNIGIGTNTPGAKLDVAGTIKISGGTPGAGKVLTSDASGLASWTTPTSGLGGSGTINKIAKFTAGTTVADSQIYDNGTNVGIGTTAPTAKLDIAGTYSTSINPSYAGYQEIPAGTNFYTGSGNLSFLAKETAGLKTSIVYYGAPNYYSALEVANTASGLGNLLLMKSGGNVGIGTTAPGNLLTVNGTIQGSTLYATTQIGASSVTADYLSGSSPLNLYSGGSSYMAFSTNGEKVRILNNGNVGIGTTNPSYQLHIANSSATATFALVGGAGQAGVLYIGANGSIDTALGEAAAAGQIVITSALYDTVLKSGSTQNILFGIGTAEKMRITSAGNVGIGVTTPDSNYKLTTTAGGGKFENNDATNPAGYFDNLGAGPDIEVKTGGIKFSDGVTQTIAMVNGYRSQLFTSSGTWVRPSGVTSVWVSMTGGGGGGAGAAIGGAAAGGGGGGAASIDRYRIDYISGNVTVTVGAAGAAGNQNTDGGLGGTSSFGPTGQLGSVTVTATGGYGGYANGTGGSGGAPNIGSQSGSSAAGGASGNPGNPGAGGQWIAMASGGGGGGGGGTVIGGTSGSGGRVGFFSGGAGWMYAGFKAGGAGGSSFFGVGASLGGVRGYGGGGYGGITAPGTGNPGVSGGAGFVLVEWIEGPSTL